MASAFGHNDIPLQTFPVYGSGGGYYVPADYGVSGGVALPEPVWLPAPSTATAPATWGSPAPVPLYPHTTLTPMGSINAAYIQPAQPQQFHTGFNPQAKAAREAQAFAVEGAKQRCTKCRSYFTAAENVDGACVYHPGHYATPDTAGPVMMPASTLLRWSCCRSPASDAPGCRQQRHVVDAATAAILRKFDTSAGLREGLAPVAGGGLTQASSSSDDDEDSEEYLDYARLQEQEHIRRGIKKMHAAAAGADAARTQESGGTDGVVMVRHLVAKTDTLAGLSLRYGVKVDDIKQANNLTSQSIFAHKFLLVPNPARTPAPEELSNTVMPKDGKKGIAVERFRAVAKCDKEEASFYLEEHEFDVERALAAFRADLEWEKQAPQPKKTTTKTRARRNYN